MDQAPQPLPAGPSLGTRIMNVLAAPAEAFDGVTALPSKTTLWLVPFLLMIVVTLSATFLVMTDEGLRQQILDAQVAALEQRVADGRMTQEDLNQAQEQMAAMGSMFLIVGLIGAAVIVPVYYFVAALALWLGAKLVLKSQEKYGTALAVYGLSSWIGILGGIVGLLMILGLGSVYAGPTAAVAISEFSPTNFLHVALSKIDLFGLWQTAVIGIGLSKISGKSAGMGVVTAFGLWLLWVVVQLLWFIITN